jgi:hypothetical protein
MGNVAAKTLVGRSFTKSVMEATEFPQTYATLKKTDTAKSVPTCAKSGTAALKVIPDDLM